jgi:dihydroorotate dehydrogenase
VWVKLTPASADIAEEAGASFLGGADAVSSTNTFPALPVIDPQTLEFEVNVDGFVSPGGLGGPAILPQSLAKMAELVQAFPDREFSGVGGISTFDHALSYFLLGCGTVQVATAAMLDHAIGPNVIRGLVQGMSEFLERHADRGWTSLDDFRGRLRDRVVAHSRIARPGDAGYRPGSREAQEAEEGYAPEPVIA